MKVGMYSCVLHGLITDLLCCYFRFQFNPQDFDYSVAISVLLKALTAAPFPDFNLCLSLLGEANVTTLPSSTPSFPEDATEEQKEEIRRSTKEATSVPAAGNLTDPLIVKLSNLSSYLLSARFRLFWKTFASADYSDVREFAKGAHGFEDAIRQVALESVKGAFRTISSTRLAEYLNLSKQELPNFISQYPGWTIEGEQISVPANPDNDVKATVIREDVQVDQLSKLLSQSQTPILRV